VSESNRLEMCRKSPRWENDGEEIGTRMSRHEFLGRFPEGKACAVGLLEVAGECKVAVGR
jgi:hypothetical protein